MTAYPPTARQCLELAAAAAPAMVERAIERAITALQEEERQAQGVGRRQEIADAWLELTRRRKDWAERYPALLELAQAGAPEAERIATRPAGARKPALSLVDDDTLAESLEAARLLQLLAPRLEQPLAELDALMSSALGLATVQPERNPLRPDVFAQSLRTLMQPAGQPQWPALWSKHIAPPFAGELVNLYRDALQLLKGAKLQAATYRVLPTPSAALGQAAAKGPAAAAIEQQGAPRFEGGPPAQSASFQAGHTGPVPGGVAGLSASGVKALGGSAWADISRYELGDELFQHFLYARTPPSAQALAPAYYAQVDAQVAAIEGAPEAEQPFDRQLATQFQALPPVERPHRAVGTASALDEAVWGKWAPARERALHRSKLKKDATQVGQVLGLEVVRKLVDQVARDPRLLAPVREAIVALEPALLRLALIAPRFFSQENHAGRRLVERVAERSFRYNDEFGGEFQDFFGGVRAAFHALNEAQIDGDVPFAQALERLEAQWASEDAIEERGRQVAVGALYFAEARDAEAGQIAWSLSQRSDLDGVPAVVQDFLYGPWSLVMAHARLTDPERQMDPGGWSNVVGDLLWSVKGDQALRDPSRLIATIPVMLERLRSGLALLGQEGPETETFFQALEKLHRPVLKLRARQRQAERSLAAAPEIDAALLSTERHQPKPRAGDPWMTRFELQAAGFEENANSGPAPLEAVPAPPATAAAQAPEHALGDAEVVSLVDGLRQGSWVDLHAHARWRRASLTWVSSRATLFMFVSHGGRPHSMTRRTLERLVRDRMLRPVETGAVVSRAIEELSQREARPQAFAA
jgi:hypothetical protein